MSTHEELKLNDLSPDEAARRILAIQNNVSILGFNEAELGDLAKLAELVMLKEMSPVEALKKAEEIRDSKQDYH